MVRGAVETMNQKLSFTQTVAFMSLTFGLPFAIFYTLTSKLTGKLTSKEGVEK